MDPKLPEPLSELLEYVEGIGYGDLYLRVPHGALRDVAPRGSRPDAGRPEGRTTASPSQEPVSPQRPAAPSREPAAPSREPAPPPREAQRRALKPSASPLPGTMGYAAATAASSPPTAGPLLEGGVPDDVAGRIQAMAGVAGRASSCQACGLCRGRRNVVFGQGHPDADLMLIGEGPGAQEDRQGLPFVGPAGELLNKIITAIDETREGVYIANVVKCRPPNNRDPLPDEVDACRAYLEAQIDLVRPKVLVALGRVAAQALLGSRESLGRLRGRWHEVRGVPTRATYHPAALLRNAGWKRPTWEDMQLVRDRLRELRSR